MKLLDLQLKRASIIAKIKKGNITESIENFKKYRKELLGSFFLHFLDKKYYEEIAVSKKLFSESLYEKSHQFLKNKKYIAGHKCLYNALIYGELNEELIKKYINCLLELEDYHIAKNLANCLIKKYPRQDNYNYLVDTYLRLKQYSKALKYLKKYTKNKDINDDNKEKAAFLYKKLYDDTFNPKYMKIAFKYFKELHESHPDDLKKIYNLLVVAQEVQDNKLSQKLYEKQFSLETPHHQDIVTYYFI